MNPVLSIIVPIYNVEKYLKTCIESIVSQNTKYSYEILLVNDGSPDNSQEIIDYYVNKYSFVKGFEKINGGLSDARNFGIERAKGEYVSFVDADDYISTCFVEKTMEEALKTDADMIITSYELFNNKNNKLNKKKIGAFDIINKYKDKVDMKKLIMMTIINAWARVYRKSLFDEVKFPLNIIHEDLALIPYLTSISNSITLIETPLYYYRLDNDSSITSNLREEMFDMYKALKFLYSLFGDKFDEYYDELQYLAMDQLVLILYVRLLSFKGTNIEDIDNIKLFMEQYFGKNWSKSYYIKNHIKIKAFPSNAEYLRHVLPIHVKLFSINYGKLPSKVAIFLNRLNQSITKG